MWWHIRDGRSISCCQSTHSIDSYSSCFLLLIFGDFFCPPSFHSLNFEMLLVMVCENDGYVTPMTKKNHSYKNALITTKSTSSLWFFGSPSLIRFGVYLNLFHFFFFFIETISCMDKKMSRSFLTLTSLKFLNVSVFACVCVCGL